MDNYQLDYSDIVDIFKEKLKIENKVKTIDNIFNNERYFSKIDYKPYFQRNYVWDDEKATYFIESILIGTEIPPLVLFQTKNLNEVIDGRQRFETIDRFLKDKLTLKNKGLKSLKSLSGKKYSQLDHSFRDIFNDTRIRILQFEVVNEPGLSDIQEDKIKKEIFRRYNSGITPLQMYDIDTAMFITDQLSSSLKQKITEDKELLNFLSAAILPKSKVKANDRDKINILLTEIRELIALEYIPIYEYAKSSKTELVRKAYFAKVSTQNVEKQVERFLHNIAIVKEFYKKIKCDSDVEIKSIQLFTSCLYWVISILTTEKKLIRLEDIDKILSVIKNKNNTECFDKLINYQGDDYTLLFEQTGSHYYAAVMNRFTYISNVFSKYYNINLYEHIKSTSKSDFDETEKEEYCRHRINKAYPETLSIEDIMRDMGKQRFLIRPIYQRSEVTTVTKASYLMESIMLGINIPPLFVYKRNDGIKEVVDGQQRLLTMIGYLGKAYMDENGITQYSAKNKFKLKELKILSELKGKNIDQLEDNFKNKILDFQMDVIEIDGNQNPTFSPIDLFLRLNTKPYPIRDNTFEMWNAYLDKRIILRAKDLANKYQGIVFRQKDKRMKVEELITSLAYLDYKIRNNSNVNSILCIYVKHGKLCARLMSKSSMTKQLNDISINDPEEFLKSLDNVNEFSEKLFELTNGENSKLKYLVNHSIKGTSFKTDQNFYFMWFVLKEISLEEIKNNTILITENVRKHFNKLQEVNESISKEQAERILMYK